VLESDIEATEEPAAQDIEHSAEDEGTCGDDGKANKSLNTAAADHPIEHLDGIEGNGQKQGIYGHAERYDPCQCGSPRNQSEQRSSARR
jgi:hypothetical protein